MGREELCGADDKGLDPMCSERHREARLLGGVRGMDSSNIDSGNEMLLSASLPLQRNVMGLF